MPFFSRKSNSRSNPAPCNAGAQHLIYSQSTYQRFKIYVSCLFGRSRTATQVPAVDITALGIGQAVPDPLSGISAFPVATQFQGAQGINISGHPRFTNMTTVNNYGGTHGLENLKPFVSFAALHDSAEQDPKRRCHPGTRKNVLSQLRDWFDNPNATDRICWLYGPAGAGKSAIAQTIADEYKERGLAATFFFYRSDSERYNGNRLLPTLAWQLAFSIPAIKNFIIHALDKTPHLPRKDVETQFEQLLIHPFRSTNNIGSQLSQLAPVVIIDGLDECSDEELQRRILTIIGNAVKDSRIPLRFLICSRPEVLIEEVLNHFKDFTLRIDLATLDDSNRDIEKYLVDQFSVIASKRGLNPTWPNPEIIEEFVFKSSGNFIFAAMVMRYISDEDCDPEEQLDIVRNLKPRGKMSPFALLDELYLEILKQQRDQDFLKTFLALFVTRSLIVADDLHEDDAMLMNVSEKNLHIKLRRMRSLLKFEPFVDVHHKSFLDFVRDSSRSGQYHVSEQDGQKRYLALIVESVFRHVSMAIEQPNDHKTCRSIPSFRSIVQGYPPKLVLPVEDWKEALKPLLRLQDRLLNSLRPQSCHFSQVMRELLLHFAILQGNPRHIAATQVLEPNINETVTEQSLMLLTEAEQNIHENDLDRCLYVLLSNVQKTNLVLAVDKLMIERMSSLLEFDYAETAARVRSVVEAQKLIDIIDLLIHNEIFLSHCGPDAACKAALLASEIYSRVPLLPRPVFLNRPTQQYHRRSNFSISNLEHACQGMFITRILDHNYIIPFLCIYQGSELEFVHDKINEQDELVNEWLERSRPNFVTRIRVILEIGRTIRYIHSMEVVAALNCGWIKSCFIALDSNLRAKIMFHGYFACQVREKLIYENPDDLVYYTTESNITAFGNLFDEVCFGGDDENLPEHIVEDARQLIERCRTKDPKGQPTMVDVVKEMESWNLT